MKNLLIYCVSFSDIKRKDESEYRTSVGRRSRRNGELIPKMI